eukprot:15345507-Ditylum_brightwellii.AAC.2
MNVENGLVGDPNTVNTNLLTQFASLLLDGLKRHANQYFSGDETSNNVPNETAMVAATINPANNAMHKRCYYRQLELQKSRFVWKKDGKWIYDGPTIAWLMLTKLNPTSNIGVTAEICFIETVKMNQYNNNVHDMLDNMDLKCNKIQEVLEEK